MSWAHAPNIPHSGKHSRIHSSLQQDSSFFSSPTSGSSVLFDWWSARLIEMISDFGHKDLLTAGTIGSVGWNSCWFCIVEASPGGLVLFSYGNTNYSNASLMGQKCAIPGHRTALLGVVMFTNYGLQQQRFYTMHCPELLLSENYNLKDRWQLHR